MPGLCYISGKDFLSERFELHCEVAHKFGFPYDLHATGDFMTTVIHVLERSGNHIHMVVGVSAAADAETQEVVSAETVLTGYGITVGKDVADFAATHAGFTIKLHSERLGREFLLRNAVEHLVCIDEDGMAANGTLIRDAVLVELLGKIFNLLDAGLKHIELGILVKTYGKSCHIAAVHTAVSKEAFERNAVFLCAFIPVLPTGSDETAHIHEAVLLGRHRHAVGKSEHLAADFLDGLVGIAFFTGLDEICVLGKTCGVENHALVVLVSDFAHLSEVGHAHRLTAGCVVGDGNDDERDLVGVLSKAGLKLLGIHIAFERHLKLRVLGLVHSAVHGKCLAAFDVPLSGVEMRVARNDVARLHEM